PAICPDPHGLPAVDHGAARADRVRERRRPVPRPPVRQAAMTALLQTRALHKHFGGLAAVTDVNFEIATGEIHCLIGPNGAGKSTLFKLMAGTYAPSSGEVLFRGENVTHRKPYERVDRGMSIKLQVPSIF